jgi:ribosomal protein S18 acetylase RimI-like enzyme
MIQATDADRDAVVEILVSAFYDDPTWSWAFPDPTLRRDHHRRLWAYFTDGALRYPWLWLDDTRSATALWIPPGGSELSAEQGHAVEQLVVEVLGADADRVLNAIAMFDAALPHEEPHFYLTLLGTTREQHGNGYGLGLLADTLALIDEAAMPAYLEASNPANVALYRRYGFDVRSSFQLPADGPEVVTMWRPTGPV